VIDGAGERHHDVFEEFWEYCFEGDGTGINTLVDTVQTSHALIKHGSIVRERNGIRYAEIVRTVHSAIT